MPLTAGFQLPRLSVRALDGLISASKVFSMDVIIREEKKAVKFRRCFSDVSEKKPAPGFWKRNPEGPVEEKGKEWDAV